MDRAAAHAALQGVADTLAAQHADQPDRLHQLLSHIATARMAIDHLFDHAANAAAGG